MAAVTIHGQDARTASHSILDLVAAPFRVLGRSLVHMAERSPMGRQVERLGRMSDEQLAARGLTREGEIRRIFGNPALH